MAEDGPATLADAFSDAAAAYAAARPAYPEQLFVRLSELAPNRALAWDVGTGNGQAAVGLARHFDRVEATDASAEQVAFGLAHARVRYSVAPAEASGLADGSVDVISVAQALHWFGLSGFYAEVRRVARPGALLAVYGYSWFYLTPELDALAEQFLWTPVASYWSPNNRVLWHGYRTIEFPFEEYPEFRLAMHLQWNMDQLFDFYLTASAPRRKLKAQGDAYLSRARDEFERAWGEPGSSRHVVMPMHVRLGRVS